MSQTYDPTEPYRQQVAQRVVPRVIVVVLAGIVIWAWGQSRPYPISNLSWIVHVFSATGALVYGGVALYVADLADDGDVDDPYVRIRYALIAPATLSHELMHATAARLLGGQVHQLTNDGGVFAIGVDVPRTRSRWLRATVDLAPTIVGIPLVISMGLYLIQTLNSDSLVAVDLMATIAFIYAQIFAIPSEADIRSAWATLSGQRDRERLEATAQSDD